MHKNQIKLFCNPKPIYTPRLVLRKIEKSDLSDVYEYSKNPNVSRYLLWSAHRNEGDTRAHLSVIQRLYRKGQFYDYAITLKESGKMIGTCGFTRIMLDENAAEIGYVLNEAFWHMGYAREAVGRIIDFARDVLKLERLYAEFIAENENSRELLTHFGFFERSDKSYEMLVKGEFKNIIVFEKVL
jgi:ribosomal-protein-alanine N-acetyltransferase